MTRPMVTVGIPFLACALLVSFLSDGVCLGLAVALAAGLLLSVFLARGAVRLRLFSIFAAALCACAGWMGYLKYRAAATDFLPGGSFSVTGVIEDYEPADSGRGAYTVRVISHDAKGLPAEFKALLYADGDLDCTWYDRIMVKAEILPFFKTPEFDGERYYRCLLYTSRGTQGILKTRYGKTLKGKFSHAGLQRTGGWCKPPNRREKPLSRSPAPKAAAYPALRDLEETRLWRVIWVVPRKAYAFVPCLDGGIFISKERFFRWNGCCLLYTSRCV